MSNIQIRTAYDDMMAESQSRHGFQRHNTGRELAREAGLSWNRGSKAWTGTAEQVAEFGVLLRETIENLERDADDGKTNRQRGFRLHAAALRRVLTGVPA